MHARVQLLFLRMTISTQANVCFSQAFDEPWERSVVEFTAVNITGFRMVDPDRKLVKDFLSRWATLDTNQFEGGGKRYISVSLLEKVYIQVLQSVSQQY